VAANRSTATSSIEGWRSSFRKEDETGAPERVAEPDEEHPHESPDSIRQAPDESGEEERFAPAGDAGRAPGLTNPAAHQILHVGSHGGGSAPRARDEERG
jgi:hypothetical protein